MDRFRKALFKGRRKKLKYAAAVLFLVCACVATLGTLVFTSMTSRAQYELTGLEVRQEGTGLEASWDDADASGYAVFLQSNGERPKIYSAKEPRIRISLDVLGRDYRVTVTAMNRFGGLSGALSKNIRTEKLPQQIETEKDKYVGLKNKKRNINAEAHGTITYTSTDTEIVSVSKRGIMSFGTEGRARIHIKVAEGDQYKSAAKTIAVTVYPDELDTPVLKVSRKTDENVTLKWNKVEYARGYTLRKYDPAKDKYYDFIDYGSDITKVKLPRDQARYKVMATAMVEKDRIESDPSKAVRVVSSAEDAPSYSSGHNLMTLNGSNLQLVARISGSGGASVPQSMSHVGDDYVVTFVNHGGSAGALVTYSNEGERKNTVGISGMGHANGSTYNPNTNRIYTVKTHRQIRSSSCTDYDPAEGGRGHDFQLPRVTSGIAYDETNDKFILSKGNELYVCDSDFTVEKFIWKRARYNHAQDIGAYNGVAMVCTWVSGNTSYIDLYRISDGAYIGSYYVPIGEIESCFVDDKHLIILMNNGTGGLGDCILRTADPIALP